MTTQHSHGPNFGRRVATCPRCIELTAGAPAIQWRESRAAQEDAQRVREIRAHDCARSRCGVVCTFGDY